ncbi:MAG TPA: carboxypeptidase regulatory-like domain-containing protein [Bryobacteraceae bacterium]|nr:carboxypeptidase regulatory-like domain-containing protein [Bryobacteraceae bacterium]
MKSNRSFTSWILLTALLAGFANAQSSTASLTGIVTDPQGEAISGATVRLIDPDTRLQRETKTARDGLFVFGQALPSTYTLRIEQLGFATAEVSPIVLNVADQSAVRVQLKVAQRQENITVQSDAPLVSESPSVGTVINRQFMENQPLNGRSFQTLVELSPGVTLAPSSLPTAGQFSVNGQRTSTNYFTVDGVSGNFGSTASVTLYESAGGSIPSYSALGTTTSLASVDAVQEFSIQTSTYAPEFGRQPGGQVSIVTRSGTNTFHGSTFDFLRNSALDANNFFANANALVKPAERQNDFGATLGGPVSIPRVYQGKDHTFFFVSYEGVRVRQPSVTSPLQVPSLAARQNATGITRDLLNAFPLPTGPTLVNDPTAAPYIGSFSNPQTLNATSIRIDHSFGNRFTMFGRYNHAPSEDQERARFCAASCVADLTYSVDTATFGATMLLTSTLSNDFRFNFSRSRTQQVYYIDTFGGAVVPPSSSLYPSFTTRSNGYIYIELDPSGANTISDGLFSDNRQRQWNVVDTTSSTRRGHSIKFGVDYRRLMPVSNSGNYKRSFLPDDIADLVNNVPTAASIVAPQVVLRPIYNNLSLFAQDAWKVSRKLTLTYGVRYEVNPPPSEENGNLPPTVTNVSNPAALSLAPAGTQLYKTTWNNFAPRAGFAFQPFEQGRTVLRGGFGVFYDLGYDFTGSAFSTGIYPFARTLGLSSVTFTSPAFAVQPPPVSTNPPYPRVFAYSDDFKIPYTLQYNFAVEQGFGRNDSVSVSYVGSSGRRLGRVESLRKANPNFPRVDIVRDDGQSNYNALQLEYKRHFWRGFQALTSYTFGKSLDNVSDESINNFQAPTTKYNPNQDYGPSSFDIRHTFTGAISYELPSLRAGVAKTILGGFALDGFLRSRSATPVNVLTGRDALGLGFTTVTRPDLVPGIPLYVSDPNTAGGKRINPAAFNGAAPTAASRQGTLGRDVLRGFGATQLDLSLRRQFRLKEHLVLQARADAFNILNHPNLANPVAILTDPNFGRSTQLLGTGLGGLSALYQVGGPRSLQLALKLLF